MKGRTGILAAAAVLLALAGAASPAAGATWTTEPVPAGPGALGPARLAFDAQGRGLLLFNGAPSAAQPRFTGVATRAPAGGWTRAANLPGVGWGNAQALEYATTRVLFVSGQVASVGRYNRARLRLVAAVGRSDGTGLGRWHTLAPYESGFVAAANAAGQAIVLYDAGGAGLSAVERPRGGAFGRAVRVSPAGATTPAVAVDARGDRLVAWVRSGRIEARVRRAGHGWGSVLKAASAPRVSNLVLRAAITPGGSFVLAWGAADIRESRPTRLLAGVAQRRAGHGWRASVLEDSTLVQSGSFVGEQAPAVPLVTGGGTIVVAWTGTVAGGGHAAVKAARLTSSGPRVAQVVSGGAPDAALAAAAAGPGGRSALVFSQFDAQAHAFTYAALSPAPGAPFAPPDLLTPSDATGIAGPAVAFQPLSGQAVVMVPVIEGTSGGYLAAVENP